MSYLPILSYRLAKHRGERNKLICDADGVSLGPAPLVTSTRDANGRTAYQVASPQWIADVLAVAYGPGFDAAFDYRVTKVALIARALGGGRLTEATLAALNLHLPELSDEACDRLGLLAKYSPDQPRDWHGRWAQNGDAGAGSSETLIAESKQERHNRCVDECLHLLPSPSGDLQSSEYRKCYRECVGSLG